MDTDDVDVKARWRGLSPVAFAAGGFGAAFAAASCCGLPIALGGLGVGTTWLFGLAVRAAPHRGALLALAAALLGAGTVAAWRQSRGVCSPDAWCARPAVRALTVVGLAVGALLWWLGYRYV